MTEVLNKYVAQESVLAWKGNKSTSVICHASRPKHLPVTFKRHRFDTDSEAAYISSFLRVASYLHFISFRVSSTPQRAFHGDGAGVTFTNSVGHPTGSIFTICYGDLDWASSNAGHCEVCSTRA